jgi:hypothetical protein
MAVTFTDVGGGQSPVSIGDGTLQYGDTLTINNVSPGRLAPPHIITLTGNPLVRITNNADFAIGTPPSTPVADGASTTFVVNSLSQNGAATTVTISGQDSVAGEFFFTFTLDGPIVG